MTDELDPLTRCVYTFVRDYLQAERRSPSLREIGDGCYVGHTTILSHLARLEGMGWIEREIGVPRSIRLGEYAPDYQPHEDET